MSQVTGSVVTYPARASFAAYLSAIVLGGLLLKQPFCRVSGVEPISLIDALFTATSAVCVTGLTVRSTGNDFSLLGQLVILGLVQLGGIGIMTVTTLATFRIAGRTGLRQRQVVAETLGARAQSDLGRVLRSVILITFLFEGLGFLLLLVRYAIDYPWPTAVWHAAFHSISAFCNAGFGLRDDSLTQYQGDALLNLTICALIILGGIGFPVMLDVWRHRRRSWIDFWDHLHVHTKTMIIGTAALLLLGTVVFLMLEWHNTLRGMPLGRRLLVALFHSTSTRTAGFNTVDIGALTTATLFIMVLLMTIGGGPCSTAGGFKVSTFMTLVYQALATFRGYNRVSLFRRTVPVEIIQRATAVAFLFIVVAVIALTSLLVYEQSQLERSEKHGMFIEVLFETTSALGTVGLSTGITPRLSDLGRVILIVLMFMGRLGPISVFIALSRSERVRRIEYPQEEPLIG